jgi:hypothetical protein
MRNLSQTELNAVSGAGTTVNLSTQIDAFVKALAAKGISLALDSTAGTLTITTSKGAQTLKVPAKLLAILAKVAPTPTV